MIPKLILFQLWFSDQSLVLCPKMVFKLNGGFLSHSALLPIMYWYEAKITLPLYSTIRISNSSKFWVLFVFLIRTITFPR